MMNESTNYNTTSYTPINATALPKWDNSTATGKSFSEALILASTNPQYDKRLFIDLPVLYMKTILEHVVYINCFECQKNKINLWTQHVLKCSFHARTGKSMNNLLSYCWLVVARISASEKDLPVL